jgi:hypothetical protein
VAWIVAIVGLMYAISTIANWMNQRHDEWLQKHGIAVPAIVVPGAL